MPLEIQIQGSAGAERTGAVTVKLTGNLEKAGETVKKIFSHLRPQVDYNFAEQKISVKLGVASVSTIEVQQGLNPGDSVIVSDMSRFDNVQKVRIQR